MIIYIDMTGKHYGNLCFKRDMREILVSKGYEIYSEAGKYWKCDTVAKSVVGCKVAPKFYDDTTGFDVFRSLL